MKEFYEVIEDVGKKYQVPLELIKAICHMESNWDPYAARFESKWSYFHLPVTFAQKLRISVDTERTFQSTSWGLMQVMGTVAREQGFNGHLNSLHRPELGLLYGAKKLAHLRIRYQKLDDVIASYNSGHPIYRGDGSYSNQIYVNGVKKLFETYKKE